MTAGVQTNDADTLKAFFAQIPDDQKNKLKEFIEAVKTPRPDDAPPAGPELTQDQMDNVKKAFEAIDQDKNGSIEMKEFIDVMQALNVTMTEEECTEVFKAFDVNGAPRFRWKSTRT